MKKKIKTTLFVFIIIGVIVLNITYKNKNEVTKTKQRNQNNLAIMIKGDSGEYVSSNEIPKGNYVLNEEKTICENGGKVVSYNNSTGQIGFSFLGSDRCSLYFDKIIDTQKPVISNLKINGKTITATLTDNQSLLAYGFSTSNTLEPTSWTSISGKTYNLSTTIKQDRVYYLWVKDNTGNVIISDVLDARLEGWKTILINNGNGAATVDAAKAYIEGKTTSTTPNFSTVATTNEGMYSAPDDLGTSYYFRGAVDNNWLKYGKYTKDMYNCNNGTISATDTGNSCTKIASSGDDIYWRIIRINGDNSIRMIYTGTSAPDSNTKVVMTESTNNSGYIRATSAGRSKFNQNYNSAEYVGYMYTIGEQHGTSQSSDIKTYLDNWYANYTDLNKTGTKITDQIYCNDRTASTSNVSYSTTNYTTLTSWNSKGTLYFYGANGRISNDNNPMLTCAVDSDRFTVNKINGKGNSSLTYPIGLITIDEVEMAGNNWSERNTSYYLLTMNDWLGSPNYFRSGVSAAYGFYADNSGFLDLGPVSADFEVHPVVSLSSKAKLSGNGTYSNPYTVS